MSGTRAEIEWAENELLWSLAEGTTHQTGPAYLEALVATLAGAVNVNLALLTEGVEMPQPKHARTVFAWRGGPVENWDYSLEDTPCAIVYGGERVIIPCGVKQRFPRDHLYEGYAGIPLRGRDESVAGHLAVFSEAPLEKPQIVEQVLRLYGLRAQAELQRLLFDRERERHLDDMRVLNQRLLHRYRLVRSANTYKTQMLGIVAHDLRSPLASILSRAELIEASVRVSPVDTEKTAQSCVRIIEAAERMGRRISMLMDSAREEEAIGLDRRPYDLVAAVRAAVEVNQTAADRKSITVSVEGPVKLMLAGDETQILEAVDNLLSNAIKYSDSGSAVQIRIGARDAVATVSVADQGQGLDEADLAKAFQPFTRLSARPTGGEESVGLGLASVRMIAERHGGTVGAESPGKGRGATFTLHLPIP